MNKITITIDEKFIETFGMFSLIGAIMRADKSSYSLSDVTDVELDVVDQTSVNWTSDKMRMFVNDLVYLNEQGIVVSTRMVLP